MPSARPAAAAPHSVTQAPAPKNDAESRARSIADGLYPHQVDGVAFLLGRRRAILADDMGLGKTRQSVVAATVAEPEGPYLVVCPASVKHNWAREIHAAFASPASRTRFRIADAPQDPHDDSDQPIDFLGSRRREPPEVWVVGPAPLPEPDHAGWTIVNYDLLKRHIDGLLARPYKALVFDEGHYIKNHRSQRSVFARRLVNEGTSTNLSDGNTARSPVVHVLTGTPLTNRPSDLFPLLQLVGHALGQSFLAFAKRYCDGHKNDYGYWETKGVSNADELAVQLQGTMLRRRKDDTLDLPPKQRTWIDVDIDEDVRQRWNEAVAGFIRGERNETGRRVGVGLMSSARRRVAVAKVPVTLEYVRGVVDQGEKVILFSHSTKAITAFARDLGDLAVTITGKVPTSARQPLVDRFQTDDSVRVFIGQIHAAGVGINLTAARVVVFNDLDWVPANHWQAEDRAHRIGQRGSVHVAYMIARGTMEEYVRTVLETKSRLVDAVVEGQAITDAMDGDVLSELRNLLAHLDDAVLDAASAEPDAVQGLLRDASDRYLAANAARLGEAAKQQLKPVSDRAIAALAAVLTGPQRTVYQVASSSGKGGYRVEVEGADIACDCKGFAYRGMCRHARDLKTALASGRPVPEAYRRVA